MARGPMTGPPFQRPGGSENSEHFKRQLHCWLQSIVWNPVGKATMTGMKLRTTPVGVKGAKRKCTGNRLLFNSKSRPGSIRACFLIPKSRPWSIRACFFCCLIRNSRSGSIRASFFIRAGPELTPSKLVPYSNTCWYTDYLNNTFASKHI